MRYVEILQSVVRVVVVDIAVDEVAFRLGAQCLICILLYIAP